MMAVSPSKESATAVPCCAGLMGSVLTSLLPCWLQTPPLRVKTHVAPVPETSSGPPSRIVLPSPEMATDRPSAGALLPPVPKSFGPCCVQTPALRVKTQAAPALELSPGPPRTAVSPSAERATAFPWFDVPTLPVPTSFGPCCVQTPPLRV